MNERIVVAGGDVVSMDPAIGDVAGGDVLVEDGRISQVGRGVDSANATVIDAVGKIVIPGFVDTHRHTWQSQLRGLAVDCTAPQYRKVIRHRFGPAYEPADVYAGTLLGALEALDCGITTLVDWAHIMNTPEHADASVAALLDSGVRAVFAHGTPNGADAQAWYERSELPHPSDIRRVRDRYFGDEHRLLTLAMGARPPHNVTPDVLRHDWHLARELGIRITVDGVGRGRWSGLDHDDFGELERAGLLGADTTYVHGNQLTDGELRMMAATGGTSSIAPEIEMNCGHGTPATGRLVAAGVRPSLSTDVPAMCGPDMFTVMRMTLAAERMRLTRASDDGWPESWHLGVRDVLEFATIAGARACGLADRTGSLTPGKRADLVVIDRSGLNLTAVDDPVAAVVCFASVRDVDVVMVDGRLVKRAGRPVGDVDRARELAVASRRSLCERSPDPATGEAAYDWKW
ncbi:MAG: amidohydrolase family protein [Streptosporangiales bacterium]|nr:amidohydrolase family protein [Streptosporangiales bacterium]